MCTVLTIESSGNVPSWGGHAGPRVPQDTSTKASWQSTSIVQCGFLPHRHLRRRLAALNNDPQGYGPRIQVSVAEKVGNRFPRPATHRRVGRVHGWAGMADSILVARWRSCRRRRYPVAPSPAKVSSQSSSVEATCLVVRPRSSLVESVALSHTTWRSRDERTRRARTKGVIHARTHFIAAVRRAASVKKNRFYPELTLGFLLLGDSRLVVRC